MKSAVESLSSTRVKLTVEAPFADLKHALDVTYKEIGGQVRVPGFRPGKVPARMIDQRVGRGYVLEQAVNHAIPELYSQAVQDNSVQVVGQPSVDVTEFGDGEQLVFTAEVDVRPEVTLPDHHGIAVTVDDLEVTDEQIQEQLDALRDRFAVLSGVERPAAAGDFVSLSLAATVDGEPVPELATKGLSYEVGGRTLLEGLDDAVAGLSAGESATFTTRLVGGEYADRDAEVTVTVESVKEKQLPELDDDFAQLASEFDTLEELRVDLAERLGRARRVEQGVQARDRVLEALLAQVDIELPESMVEAEKTWRRDSLTGQLERFGLTLDGYLQSEGRTQDEWEAEFDEQVRSAVKGQLVLDALVAKEAYGLTEAELTQHVVRRAQQSGMDPQQFANQAMQAGQIPVLAGEVLRGKALADVLEHAQVTDASGREVDLSALEPGDIDPSFADLDEAELDEEELDEEELDEEELDEDEEFGEEEEELAEDESAGEASSDEREVGSEP